MNPPTEPITIARGRRDRCLWRRVRDTSVGPQRKKDGIEEKKSARRKTHPWYASD